MRPSPQRQPPLYFDAALDRLAAHRPQHEVVLRRRECEGQRSQQQCEARHSVLAAALPACRRRAASKMLCKRAYTLQNRSASRAALDRCSTDASRALRLRSNRRDAVNPALAQATTTASTFEASRSQGRDPDRLHESPARPRPTEPRCRVAVRTSRFERRSTRGEYTRTHRSSASPWTPPDESSPWTPPDESCDVPEERRRPLVVILAEPRIAIDRNDDRHHLFGEFYVRSRPRDHSEQAAAATRDPATPRRRRGDTNRPRTTGASVETRAAPAVQPWPTSLQSLLAYPRRSSTRASARGRSARAASTTSARSARRGSCRTC